METVKRRIVFFSLLLALALAMVACGAEQEATNPEPELGQDADTAIDQPLEESEDLVAATPEMGEDTLEVDPDSSGGVTQPSDEMAEATVAPLVDTPSAETDLNEEGVVEEDSGAIAGTVEPTPEGLTGSEVAGEEPVIPATGVINTNNLSNLDDFEIYNLNNEQIGEVEAIIIDMNSSQIKYVVAGVGGFLGLGEKSVAIPYQALTLSTPVVETGAEVDPAVESMPNAFMIDVTAETLENAPEIDLGIFDTGLDLTGDEQAAEVTEEVLGFEQQEQEIRTFWEQDMGIIFEDSQSSVENMDEAQGALAAEATPTVEASTSMTGTTAGGMTDTTVGSGVAQYVLAEQLLGATIVDQASMMNEQMDDQQEFDLGLEEGDAPVAAENEDAAVDILVDDYRELGEVEDIVIDPQSGRVRYAVVDFNEDAFNMSGDEVVTDEQATADEGILANDVLTPIPLQNLQWNAEEQTLSYSGTQSLQDLPTITYEQFQGNTSDWDFDIDGFWGIDNLDNEVNETE